MSEKENVALYQSLREVPKHAQKEFNNGNFKGTDINPMWRIQRLTEVFGPCGFGWYTEIVKRQLETSTDGKTICTFIGLNLFVKWNGEWSKPIYGEGGNTMCDWIASKGYIKTSDEAFKMAYTDALGNAAKQLGLGADVWWEADKVHATKYDKQTENAKENGGKPTAQVAPATPAGEVKVEVSKEIATLMQCKTKKELRSLLMKNNWSSKPELVSYATELSKSLPEG